VYTLFPYAEIAYNSDNKEIRFTLSMLSETEEQKINIQVPVNDEIAMILEANTKR
jgi:hypothetical protein